MDWQFVSVTIVVCKERLDGKERKVGVLPGRNRTDAVRKNVGVAERKGREAGAACL